jgi:nucleotide-binding universal stress UspA family protein
MFQAVLVPLDGSVFAEQALPMALSLARRAGCPLRLLRVVPPLADYFFWAPEPGDPLEAELRAAHRSEARTYLDDVVRRLQDAGAGPMFCDVLEEEEGITESINADVAKTGAGLVVMTSHGRGTAGRVWLGSIADKLVRSVSVPLLLVRPHEPASTLDLRREVTLKHLLLALDGSPLAEHILAPALAIGGAMGAEYTLVSGVRPASPLLHPTWNGAEKFDQRRRQAAEAYLETVAGRLRAGGAVVRTRVHFAEQPAAAILDEAAATGADLIALETHGRGGLSRLVLGSVADKVVRGSALPVLVCRQAHCG